MGETNLEFLHIHDLPPFGRAKRKIFTTWAANDTSPPRCPIIAALLLGSMRADWAGRDAGVSNRPPGGCPGLAPRPGRLFRRQSPAAWAPSASTSPRTSAPGWDYS